VHLKVYFKLCESGMQVQAELAIAEVLEVGHRGGAGIAVVEAAASSIISVLLK